MTASVTYKVKDWETHFEGSKSRSYNNKTACSMPCKHGLGFKMLIRRGGADCFGAWCALVQVLSRQHRPRNGYCTVDGTEAGRPYTSDDMEMLTDIPSSVYNRMFQVVCSPAVDWVETINARQGTVVPCQGTIVPCEGSTVAPQGESDLDSNSDSNLDLDLDKDSTLRVPAANAPETPSSPKGKNKRDRGPLISVGEFNNVMLSEDELNKLARKHGVDRTKLAIDALGAWLQAGGKRRTDHYACMNESSWVWEKAAKAEAMERNRRGM